MKLTDKVIDEFLRRIAIGGMSARRVGKQKDMPSYEAFYNRCQKDADVHRRYMLAMESRASALDDEIDDVLQQVADGTIDYNAGRLTIDTIKWRLAKYNKRYYGDNQQIDVNVENKVSFVDELKLVAEKVAERKALEAKTIEGVVIEEGEER